LSSQGQKLETAKSFSSLWRDFLIALLLVYTILAGLFRSYIQPLVVMVVVPFGIIGAITGHFLMGYPLTMLSMIGTVALTGIVVNDSMILVSFINRRVQAGTPLHEAVVAGGKSRLRPILLTTATTVLGLAPLMTETSLQAKFMIPMAIAISAGLIFATVLTLVMIPFVVPDRGGSSEQRTPHVAAAHRQARRGGRSSGVVTVAGVATDLVVGGGEEADQRELTPRERRRAQQLQQFERALRVLDVHADFRQPRSRLVEVRELRLDGRRGRVDRRNDPQRTRALRVAGDFACIDHVRVDRGAMLVRG
jgi:hypothetical protein